MRRGLDFLHAPSSTPMGSWFGRWGFNYIYGTWSVLCALNAAGRRRATPRCVRRAVAWLGAIQNEDGGWGEDDKRLRRSTVPALQPQHPSTASQTAWAVIGLMAAGEVDGRAVERGIAFLRAHTDAADGFWPEEDFTGTGFPQRLLPALPWLPEILPAVGAGALPQPEDTRTRGP